MLVSLAREQSDVREENDECLAECRIENEKRSGSADSHAIDRGDPLHVLYIMHRAGISS